MQKQYVLNRKLNAINKVKQDHYLLEKVQRAKSLLNLKCPESFTFFKSKRYKNGRTKNKCNYKYLILYIIF
jgi:hypothetical protein